METADLDYFRELLTAQLEGLLNQARQTANGLIKEADHHYNWAESSISFYDRIDRKYVVVVSPRGKIDEQALPHAKNLYFIDIGRVREIFETISGVYRRLRSQFTTYDEEEIQSKILDELIHRKLDPKSIIMEIENMPLNTLPHKR